MTRVLFVVPPGFSRVGVNHEGASGMGALVPEAWSAQTAARAARPFVYPPHTVAVCMNAVRAAGMETAFLDGSFERDARAFVAAVAASEADVLAVQVAEQTAVPDESFLRMLRLAAPLRPTLLFGASAQRFTSADLADGVLVGEPEAALAQALVLVSREGRVGRLDTGGVAPGVYAGSWLADLDALPFAAWDRVDWTPYGRVSVLTSRGCPAGCRFCGYTVAQGEHHRTQSMERVFAEWQWLHQVIRPPRVIVRDPVFAHDRDRVAALCERIACAGAALPFVCESRPEHFDRDLLRLLKAAGCEIVQIGMESGDPRMLLALGRVQTQNEAEVYLAQVRSVAEMCRREGITCRVFVMAGLPGAAGDESAITRRALAGLPPSTVIQAAAYRQYAGAQLALPASGASRATLQALRSANLPGPPVWRRIARAIKRHLPAAFHPRAATSVAAPMTVLATARAASPDASLAGAPVFLTGGSGFVGGHVARALTDAGARVVALVRAGSPPGMLDDLPVRIVRGDLLDLQPWQEALAGMVYCFHVAALYAPPERTAEMFSINAHGTVALLAACAGAGLHRFIYTGTIGTVGRPDDAGVLPNEATPFNLWDSASPYVRSKHLGEQAALSWNGRGFEVLVVKPTAPVGPGDSRPSATGRRILAALNGEAFSYPPGGVNHIPVRDVAAGHLRAALAGVPGESYILGHAGGNLDRAAFLRYVSAAAGRPLAVQSRSSAGLLDGLTADPSRAIRELGLPQSDLEAAFGEAVAWFRKNTPPALTRRIERV